MFEHNPSRTLIDLLQVRVEKTPNGDAFGVRSDDGGYRMVSWQQFWEQATRAAAGLRRLGVVRGDRVGILGGPTIEWEIAHFGCLLVGAVVVGLDPHAPAARVRDLARRAKIRGVVADRSDVLSELLAATSDHLRFAVTVGTSEVESPAGVTVLDWDSLLEESEAAPIVLAPPSPDDIATIVFTSGTTGDQKGIPYTHVQVALAVEAIVDAFPEIGPETRMLCWLPLSTPFQRILDLCAIHTGSTSYFVERPELLPAAIRKVAPDLLIGIPRFYEKLASGIQRNIAGQPWPARSLARLALAVSGKAVRARERGSVTAVLLRPAVAVLDRLVLRRIRDGLGGRIRFLVSGSAPLGPSLVEFFHACGVPMYEAYGISENIIPIAINTSSANRAGSVGRPLIEDSVKVDSDGAVHVRGAGVFAGYLGEDSAPSTLGKDGFYRTGDLGTIDDDGFLFLRGREGEIIKTSTGRRIALPEVEATLRDSPFVEQALAVGAGRKCLVSLLTVDWDSLSKEACEPPPEEASVPTIEAGRLLLEGIRRRLEALPQYEHPAGFLVLQDGFSIRDGELTPSLKMRRSAIEKRYGAAIEELFSHVDSDDSSDTPIRFISTAELRMMEFGELPELDSLRTSIVGRSWVVFKTAAKVAGLVLKLKTMRLVGAARDRWQLETYAYQSIARVLTEEIGPLKGPLVKLGQALSYVGEDLPLEIRDALSSFQEVTPPLRSDIIRSLISRQLGQPVEELFSEFCDRPLASASISQIHLARLHDGRQVVVKVKYPHIDKVVRVDLAMLKLLVPLLSRTAGFGNVRECLEELRTLILAECNFREEAKHQERFRRFFADDPEIVIPAVIPEKTTRDVLTMEYVDGQRFREFRDSATQEQKNNAARIIWKMTSTAVNRHGMFNADPHPGNYLFVDDAVCFIDFGFVKRWTPNFMEMQKAHALAAIERDVERFAKANLEMGYVVDDADFDHAAMLEVFRDVVYASWLEDRPFRFTKEFVREESDALLALQEFGPSGLVQIPTQLLAITRLFWGLHAVLADLEAEANWHRLVVPLLHEPTPGAGGDQGDIESATVLDLLASFARPAQPMPRLHLFEFDDQSWLRGVVREAYLDVLDLAHRVFSPFGPMHEHLRQWADSAGHDVVLDIASGGGGHIETLLSSAEKAGTELPKFVLSDIFPSLDRFRALRDHYGEDRVDFVSGPLSATLCGGRDERLWMVATALHHFPPEVAREIVEDAALNTDGIFIMEPYSRRRAALFIELLFGFPFAMITPFFARPFRLRKLALCTLIPVVPAIIVWDGVISILRTYRHEELESFIPEPLREQFRMEHGTFPASPGITSYYFSMARRQPAGDAAEATDGDAES